METSAIEFAWPLLKLYVTVTRSGLAAPFKLLATLNLTRVMDRAVGYSARGDTWIRGNDPSAGSPTER
jgi:hypothetical protein